MLFIVIVIMDILSSAEMDICVPSFPEIQSVFGISSFAVEFVLGINLLAHCVGALVAGNLGDKYGRKPIILSGLALFIFGSLMCALSSSYAGLLIGRFVQGIGISCPTVLTYVIIPDIYDIKTHQKLLGLLNFFSTLAAAIAPIIGSYTTLLFGWRGNFYLLLFLGILCYVWGYFFLPTGVKNNDVSVSLIEYAKVLKNKKAMIYVFTICSFAIGYWTFIAISPLLYVNDLGVKLEHFGWYQGSLAAAFALVSFSSEKLFNLFGVQKMFLVGNGIFRFGACINSAAVVDELPKSSIDNDGLGSYVRSGSLSSQYIMSLCVRGCSQ